jgi:hypothetical protein
MVSKKGRNKNKKIKNKNKKNKMDKSLNVDDKCSNNVDDKSSNNVDHTSSIYVDSFYYDLMKYSVFCGFCASLAAISYCCIHTLPQMHSKVFIFGYDILDGYNLVSFIIYLFFK